MIGDWNTSGATDDTQDCHGQLNWLKPKAVAILPYMYVWKKNPQGARNK